MTVLFFYKSQSRKSDKNLFNRVLKENFSISKVNIISITETLHDIGFANTKTNSVNSITEINSIFFPRHDGDMYIGQRKLHMTVKEFEEHLTILIKLEPRLIEVVDLHGSSKCLLDKIQEKLPVIRGEV